MRNTQDLPLTLPKFSANGRRDPRRFEVGAARTNFIAVRDSAPSLVLGKGDEEDKHRPVCRKPGERPSFQP